MAVNSRVQTLMKKNGLTAVNTPKLTPSHPSKSHVVMAYDGESYKLVRFGQQGVRGSPKRSNESKEYRKRRINWKKRHKKNIQRGKLFGAYWSNKVKW